MEATNYSESPRQATLPSEAGYPACCSKSKKNSLIRSNLTELYIYGLCNILVLYVGAIFDWFELPEQNTTD